MDFRHETSDTTHETVRSELVRAIRLADARGAWFAAAVADAVGINRTDMECIDILLLNGPTTAGGLADLSGLTTGAITGLIDRLEAAGFVFRKRDERDRRKVIVHLNQQRVEQEILPLYASLIEAVDGLHSRYTDAELAIITEFMMSTANLLHEELVKLRETIEHR